MSKPKKDGDKPAAKQTGRNTVAGRELLSFLERVERVREQKKDLADDEKLIFAEAKAAGFDTATMRNVLKRRAAKPADVEEAESMLDMYLHAIGMKAEAPLFRAVGMMSVDIHARDQVIEALSQLVPDAGEIIVKMGDQPVRLFRDETGDVQVEDYLERPVEPKGSGRQKPAARPKKDVPDVDEPGAFDLGKQAYVENQPITSNPFPWDDKRRQQFDAGWREASGTDGMGPGDDE